MAWSLAGSSRGADAASSNVVVALTIPSTTTLDASGCATGTSSVTDFGTVLPGTSNVMSSDCSLTWGSSNDTSMLRLYQTDLGGTAMRAGPASGLLGQWSLNGSTRDESPNANPLTLGSAPATPVYAPGPTGYGSGLTFDGIDDYASAPSIAAYNTPSFTVDLWFNNPTGSAETMAGRGATDCGFAGLCQWEFWIDLAGKLSAEVEVGGTEYSLVSPASVTGNGWHHAAMTVDAAFVMRAYLDGASYASTALPAAPDTGAASVWIGRGGSGSALCSCTVDEVRFQDGARTAPVIAQYYAGVVSDYSAGASDWTTPSTNMFGACLRAVSGSGVVGTWTVNATCPATNGTYWNAIPTTSGSAGAKVAASPTAATNNATASLRFGVRTASNQPPGTYVAPLVLEVVAPNV